jgi:thiamine-monophosphate kinase
MYPFSETPEETAGGIGESGLIALIRQWLGEASPPSPNGIGDDCAVFDLTPGTRGLVTTDPILWGRHFDETVRPQQAAAKLLKRNLSDIAAMGGHPVAAVVSLLLPARTSLAWLEAFHLGLREAATTWKLPIAGGDVSQTDGLLGACMTVIGQSTGERVLGRDGAACGDRILVTGSLGGSLLGRHFAFEPRLPQGRWLCARPEVTAAMDVSDGLGKDLLALLPAESAARLDPDKVPVSPDARSLAQTSGRSPLAHAFCDGEDYELLFAINSTADLNAFRDDWAAAFPELPLAVIGEIQQILPGDSIRIKGLPAALAGQISGYEHLR